MESSAVIYLVTNGLTPVQHWETVYLNNWHVYRWLRMILHLWLAYVGVFGTCLRRSEIITGGMLWEGVLS